MDAAADGGVVGEDIERMATDSPEDWNCAARLRIASAKSDVWRMKVMLDDGPCQLVSHISSALEQRTIKT